MSIAELNGKLSPESAHDRMEDLLTSDVFGTFYYIGWHEGFHKWLLEAQPAEGCSLTMRQFLGDSQIQQVFFKFWPALPNGREPDLALLLLSEDGAARVLIVEVKYQSGPSDFEIEEGEVYKDLTGSQLVDQMIGFARANQGQLVGQWFPGHSA